MHSRKKILIVEDENIVALDMRKRLDHLGYEIVDILSSGEKAVEKVRENKPDLILMDIMLKGEMDGIETAHEIKKILDIPIIYLTAYSDSITIKRAKITTPFGYISKPFSENDLHAAIELAFYKHDVELSLHESEEWFRKVFNTSIDAIVAIDLNGNVILSNPAAEKMFKIQGEEFKQIQLQSFICDESKALFEKIINSILNEDNLSESGKTVELVCLKKDSMPFPVELSLSTGNAGGKDFILIIFRDVTKRKKTEESLQKALKDAEVASKAKSDFLSIISHEIRTPMNSILGMSELALKTKMTDEQEEIISVIRQSSNSLLFLLNSILDFSKIKSGKIKLEMYKFNLRKLLEDIVDSFYSQAIFKGLEVYLKINPDIPENLIGDSKRIRQIFVNIISNAIKFTEEGEVIIRVDISYEKSLAHYLNKDKKIWLHFSIKDTGVGIPKNKSDEIFEDFTQIESSYNRTYSGTGLGLAITKTLIKLMGAEIWVDSEIGKGSTFHFRIPFEITTILRKSKKLAVFKDLNSLVVDNNETNRKILTEILGSLGFEIFEIERIRDSIDIVEQNEISLVVINELDDWEIDFVTEIKKKSKFKNIIILLLLPIAAIYNETKLKDLGVFSIVRKPVKATELLNVLMLAYGYKIDKKRRKIETQKEEKGINILLAEDDAGNQKVIKRLLEHEGYSVYCADNGNEALSVLSERKIDLILMDLRMPELDGIEATKIIRKSNDNNINSSIPIIAISARALQQDIENCLNIGFNDYIVKPINLKEFLKKIEDILGEENKKRTNKLRKKNKLKKLSIHLDDLKRSLSGEEYNFAEKYAKYVQSIAKSINNNIIKTEAFKIILSIRKGDVDYALSRFSVLEDEAVKVLKEK